MIEATISETIQGKPNIKLDDDGTIVTFHLQTEDVNMLKTLWRKQTIFEIRVKE